MGSGRLRSLRCCGGPWHGRKKLIGEAERSIAVPGVERFRYVRDQLANGERVLRWSDNEEKW